MALLLCSDEMARYVVWGLDRTVAFALSALPDKQVCNGFFVFIALFGLRCTSWFCVSYFHWMRWSFVKFWGVLGQPIAVHLGCPYYHFMRLDWLWCLSYRTYHQSIVDVTLPYLNGLGTNIYDKLLARSAGHEIWLVSRGKANCIRCFWKWLANENVVTRRIL